MSIPAPSRPILANSLAAHCSRTPLGHIASANFSTAPNDRINCAQLPCTPFSDTSGCVRIDDVQKHAETSRTPVRRWLHRKVVELIRSESGPTGVEYAVMLTLIATVVMMGITAVGTSASSS